MNIDNIKVYYYKSQKPKSKAALRLIIVSLVLFAIIAFNYCRSATNFLISDYDFTNQNYTFKQTYDFINSFPNRYTTNQVKTIVEAAREYQINVIVVLSKIQQESGTIKCFNFDRYQWRLDRAMAYGMYLKITAWEGIRRYKYGGFEVQIWNGTQALRDHFNNWDPGKKITMVNNNDIIYPINAATYSLYCFTPFYGEHNMYNRHAAGNILFIKIHTKFKNQWIKKYGGKP